ncbi:MAG: fibronectin type III domain-containing protein [Fimbriimonadales bacterium]|nr:fibronectin type III domain-containing protein [Fimbriimonadales bacterium]
MSNYNKMTDAQFLQFAQNFLNVAESNSSALGLNEGQIGQMNSALGQYSTALTARTNAFDAAKAATTTKNTKKQSMLDLVRLYANQWQANPSISNTLKQQLGLPIHDNTPTPRPVFTPTDLYVRTICSGTNWLRWNRNGNFPQTVFEIQYSYDNPNSWEWLDVTTKSEFRHTDQTPGRVVYYRVRAKRPTGISDWSNVGVAYGSWPPTELTLEEAA